MSKEKHTPEPWYPIQYAGFWGIQKVNEYAIDKDLLDVENDDRAEANAKLMYAAPDLLEALLESIKTIRAFHGELGWKIYNLHSPEMKKINSAIKKATE